MNKPPWHTSSVVHWQLWGFYYQYDIYSLFITRFTTRRAFIIHGPIPGDYWRQARELPVNITLPSGVRL